MFVSKVEMLRMDSSQRRVRVGAIITECMQLMWNEIKETLNENHERKA